MASLLVYSEAQRRKMGHAMARDDDGMPVSYTEALSDNPYKRLRHNVEEEDWEKFQLSEYRKRFPDMREAFVRVQKVRTYWRWGRGYINTERYGKGPVFD